MNMAMPIFRHTHLECNSSFTARRKNSAMPTASPGAVAGTGTPPWPRPATMPMIFAVFYGFPSRLVDQKVFFHLHRGTTGTRTVHFFDKFLVSRSTHLALDAWNIPEIKKRTCQKSQHNVGNPIINPVFGDGWNPTNQNGDFLGWFTALQLRSSWSKFLSSAPAGRITSKSWNFSGHQWLFNVYNPLLKLLNMVILTMSMLVITRGYMLLMQYVTLHLRSSANARDSHGSHASRHGVPQQALLLVAAAPLTLGQLLTGQPGCRRFL